MPAAVVGLLAFALYAVTAARTITVRYGGADGGELVATAISGGVAHPSGSPTYLLLARVALLIPWGEPAGRLAQLSALCGALAIGCTTLLVMHRRVAMSPDVTDRSGLIAGVYAGLTAMLCARVWSQAIIVEVYALHLFWLVLCTLLLSAWIATGRFGLLILTAYGLGLGLGTHLTLGALIPAGIVAWMVAPQRHNVTLRQVLLIVGALVAGLAVYGLLPIWAAREAVPSWGDTRSVDGFWRHVSGTEYRALVGVVPWSQRLARLSYAARDLLVQPGPIALGLSIGWGLPHAWRSDRPLLVLSGGVAAISLLFAIGYGGADSTVYLLPWTWAWCVWAGMGAESVWSYMTLRMPRLAPLFGALLALGLLWPLATQYRAMDLHADIGERERVIAHVMSLPPDAILFTAADADTFGVWYVQRALAVRRDVVVIDTRLAHQSWYRAQLARLLQVADGVSLCQALQTSTRPRYRIDVEDRLVDLPVGVPIAESWCASG